MAFTQAAVVIAILFVAGPFYLRGAIAAFEAIDARCPGRRRHPRRRADPPHDCGSAIPLARGGLGAAAGASFARGMGEFGATILFAGSFQGVTQTLPLAVYASSTPTWTRPSPIGVLLVFVSAAILLASKLILRSWTTWTSTSPLRDARSISASS